MTLSQPLSGVIRLSDQDNLVTVASWRAVQRVREKWSPERMSRLARANDNRGVYYNARSGRSVADLERRFRNREVGVVLEENVGAIVGGAGFTPAGVVLVQIHRDAIRDPQLLGDIKLCLRELSVELTKPVNVQRS